MKVNAVLQAMGGAFALAIALNVCAQPSSSAAASGVGIASNAQAKAAKMANRKLRHDILRALSKTPGLSNERISVRVSGSAVILSGSVPAVDQIQKAGDAVQQVPGVTTVTNKISMRA